MNVLVVSHSSIVGSYRGKLHELAQLQDAHVRLIVPPEWNEGGRRVIAAEHEPSALQTAVLPAYRLNRVASYFYHPFVFRKTVSSFAPNLLYIEEEPWSVVAWQATRYAEAHNVKLVFFTWENIWKRYKNVSERILKYVLNTAAGAVAGSHEAASILERRGFAKPVTVFPQYGVDVIMCEKSEQTSRIDSLPRPVISYMGRLEHEKGIHLLLEAVARLPGNWSLLIIGTGTAKDELKLLAERLHIHHQVKFVEAVPHEEVQRYLQQVDILVLPSLTTPEWKEQFGRILIEAMACGVTVVGSNSGAIPEVIGDAGQIFQENDSADLAGKLSFLLENTSVQDEYISRAKVRIQNLYTNKVLAKKLHDFFNRILSP